MENAPKPQVSARRMPAFAFRDGLRVIAEVALEFAGGLEAAELEFDSAGVVGESAGVLQVLGGLGGIVRNQQEGEEGVAAAEAGVPLIPVRHFAACQR